MAAAKPPTTRNGRFFPSVLLLTSTKNSPATTTDITVVVVVVVVLYLINPQRKLTVFDIDYFINTLFFVWCLVDVWLVGEGCLDKPLATLWKNYCQSSRPDVSMRLSVCSSGLQVKKKNLYDSCTCQKSPMFLLSSSSSPTWK